MNELLASAESAFARTRDICTIGITDAADYLGLGRDTVAELFADGTIATRMIGGRRKTSEAELDRYAALTTEAPRPRKARKGELESVMEKQGKVKPQTKGR